MNFVIAADLCHVSLCDYRACRVIYKKKGREIRERLKQGGLYVYNMIYERIKVEYTIVEKKKVNKGP